MSTTIKVSPKTRDQIKSLGASTGLTADQVVSSALVEYERALFCGEYARAAEQHRMQGRGASRNCGTAPCGTVLADD